MDFLNVIKAEVLKSSFGKERLELSTKQRSHTSLSMINGDMRQVNMNDAISMKIAFDKPRYAFASGITYDLLISIYDVNTTSALIARLTSGISKEDYAKIKKIVGRWKKTNIEFRAIGMQNNHTELFTMVEKLCTAVHGKLVEADLFGNEIRHVAIDLKTGMSYNVLLQDRIYRPGELVNSNANYHYTNENLKLNFV